MQATALDLITVAQANEWIFGANVTAGRNNAVLQMLISSLSLDFLRRTGRASQNSSVPSLSPFNQSVPYNENYSGHDNELIAIRNWPILSVSSVLVYGNAIPQSTGPLVYGWYIHSSGKDLGLRLGGSITGVRGFGGWAGWGGNRGATLGRGGWPKGIDCIQVQYAAGFAAQPIVGELQTIPAQPPVWVSAATYGNGSRIFDGTNVQVAQVVAGTATVAQAGVPTPGWNGIPGAITPDGAFLAWTNIGPPFALVVNQLPWLSDSGVSYFSSGTPLAPVGTAPAVGQYYLQGNGGYLFNTADAGRQVLISYSAAGTPLDIQESMLRWVNLIYNRRGWEGIRSLMQKDAGSTVYTSFEIDPSIRKVIDSYMRRA